MMSVVLKAWTIDSFRIGLQRVELYIPTPNQGINIKLWYKRCYITRTTPRRAAKFSAIFRTLQFTNSFIEKIKHRGSWYLISKSLPFYLLRYFISYQYTFTVVHLLLATSEVLIFRKLNEINGVLLAWKTGGVAT